MLNTLSLLSLKVAPNVFDVSSGLVHVSLRDQIVRARLLVRDLAALVESEKCQRLLIIGAGISGISAAAAANQAGIEVLVVDTQDAPMALQASVDTRYVGPFMYEWPSTFYNKQTYPPDDGSIWPGADNSVPKWNSKMPIKASVLAREVQSWLKNFLSKAGEVSSAEIRFLMKVDPAEVLCYASNASGQWRNESFKLKSAESWPGGKVTHVDEFNPDYIILAAGMGDERCRLSVEDERTKNEEQLMSKLVGKRFWQNDDLLDPKIGGLTVGVFGGGDGALQDVLRALTRYDHPLEFIDDLNSLQGVELALLSQTPILSAIEQQSRLSSTWNFSRSVYEVVDEKCEGVARGLAKNPLVRSRVFDSLKDGDGVVLLVMEQRRFSKTYLLNRFLVHLVEQCAIAAGGFPEGKVGLEVVREVRVWSVISMTDGRLGVRLRRSNGDLLEYVWLDRLVVRYGVDSLSASGFQMVGISRQTPADRTLLAHIAVPFLT